MGSLVHPVSLTIAVKPPPLSSSFSFSSSSLRAAPVPAVPRSPAFNTLVLFVRAQCRPKPEHHHLRLSRTDSEIPEEEDPETLVEALRVPDAWLLPSNALQWISLFAALTQESEWLRVTLHKWLDDEYCPEATNVDISKIAARSYYESLIRKQADLGEILLKMVRDLETLSFQESFHGVFSSANAAVHLITLRMESMREE